MSRAGERRNSTIDVCVCVCVCLFYHRYRCCIHLCFCFQMLCVRACLCVRRLHRNYSVRGAVSSMQFRVPCCVGFVEGFAHDVCRDLYKYDLCQSFTFLCPFLMCLFAGCTVIIQSVVPCRRWNSEFRVVLVLLRDLLTMFVAICINTIGVSPSLFFVRFYSLRAAAPP